MDVTRPSFRWITVGIWLMPFTFAATAVCLLVAFGREAAARWHARAPVGWPTSGVNRLWALVIGLGGVSTLCSVRPIESVPTWLAGLGYMITFQVAVWTVTTPLRLGQLQQALFWLGCALAAFGLVEYLANWHWHWLSASTGMAIQIGTDDRRVNSLMYHPNLLAGYLLLALAAGLGCFQRGLAWPHKAAHALGLAAIALCLLLTQSRASWIGAVCLLVSFGLWVDRRWLVALVAAAASAYALFPRMVAARLVALGWENPAFDTYRVLAWRSAIQMVAERPLTGWGPGMWATAYPHFRLAAETRHLPHAHNFYLQVAVEFGLPVVIALVTLWGWVAWRGERATRHTPQHLPVQATVCGLAGYAVSNLFDYTLGEGRNAIAFFLLLGGIEAARRLVPGEAPAHGGWVVPVSPSLAPSGEEPAR